MKNIYKALMISFVSSFIIVFLQSKNIDNFFQFYTIPLSSTYFIGIILDKFSLLLISCVGCFISLTTKNINLGGQGQIYLGGFITAFILSNVPQVKILTPVFFIITFILVILIGGIICLISSYLK